MKGLKFLASCAAIGALTTICAVSSYAATATYVDGGTVNVTGCEDYITAVGNNDLTLLVLDGTDVVTVGEANILQINQGDSSILTGIKLDTTKLDAILAADNVTSKDFEVRIGGMEKSTTYANGFISTTFTYGKSGSDNPYADSKRILGDVTGDGVVNLSDTTPVLQKSAGQLALSGETLQAADANDDGVVNLSDTTPILQKAAGQASVIDGVKTIATKTNYVNESAN